MVKNQELLTIQKSSPMICSIIELNKRKTAKNMPTFEFSTLYAKITHNKLLHFLNEIIEFAFKGGKRYVNMFFGHCRTLNLEDLTLSKKENLAWSL